jgi:nitroimidazol reductase NimA-like FMN-containing flavoprotein (pyridoxamine 5'-phosphate oxidase superfamily)
MDASMHRRIVDLLDSHRVMTIATLRPDGWPQATVVGYVNEGLTLYFLCGLDSQKAANIARDERVSITVGSDPDDVMRITGLSMAARAHAVPDPAEAARIIALLPSRYPVQTVPLSFPMPTPGQVRIVRVQPTVVSVLDYSQGFGHTDLVEC